MVLAIRKSHADEAGQGPALPLKSAEFATRALATLYFNEKAQRNIGGEVAQSLAELRKEYEGLLEDIERALVQSHLQDLAKSIHIWRQELDAVSSDSLLCLHVVRTRRSLRGVESIGEIASVAADGELLALVESLSQVCGGITGQLPWAEEATPLAERCLTIEAHISERSLNLVRAALPPERPENSAILFVGYAFADIPIGRRYKVLFPRDHPEAAVETDCEILAVTQDFAKPFDCIPNGWKTICLVRFRPGIPELIRALPTADAFSHRTRLCLCDVETWRMHFGADTAG